MVGGIPASLTQDRAFIIAFNLGENGEKNKEIAIRHAATSTAMYPTAMASWTGEGDF